MAFCNFSGEFIKNSTIQIDSDFFTQFLPYVSDASVKVYLFGLYCCYNSNSKDNSLQKFSTILNLSEDDVISCFYEWEELGLITVVQKNPFEVRYLPISNGSIRLKKFNTKKYTAFNTKMLELLSRDITPLEFNEYYTTIESLHIEPDALIMITKYCVDLKGSDVGYPYILNVAKKWIYDGIRTCEDVEQRLLEQEKNTSGLSDVLKAMGSKRNPSADEYQSYLTWRNKMDFSQELITYVAKKVGKKGGFSKLESTIEKCYNKKLFSIKEINDYFAMEDDFYDTAKQVCKNLGVYYSNLEPVVENYITKWTAMGFDKDTILKLSNYCFKICIYSLDGMNTKIVGLADKNLFSIGDIDNSIAELIKKDSDIKQILQKLGIERNVIASDRQLFKIWKTDWHLSNDVIDYAISLSADKYMPMQYLHRLLSQYHSQNITTVDEAKKVKTFEPSNNKSASSKKPQARDYSQKELNSLFDNITEVEL